MNRSILAFVLVILVAGLIGGFVGAEWSDYDRRFSPTGALVGFLGTAATLLGLGAVFDRQDQKKRAMQIPEEVRGVIGRMLEMAPVSPSAPPKSSVATNAAVQASLRRKMDAIEPAKIQAFVAVMLRLGSMTDQAKTADFARTKLLLQRDPVVAALNAQREFLNVLLDRSRGDPTLMGSNIAKSCLGVCELVLEGTVADATGREYFNSYIKVFERVHGIKMPFSGGPFDYDTSLEIARETLRTKGS